MHSNGYNYLLTNMNIQKSLIGVALVAGAGMLSPAISEAALLNYTLSGGTISGTLNGVSFTDAAYSFSSVADTNNIESGGPAPIPWTWSRLVPANVTLSIAGFGSATFMSSSIGLTTLNLSSNSYMVGFGDWSSVPSGMYIFSIMEPTAYSLAGPISLSGSLGFPLNRAYSTNAGILNLTSASGTGTFAVTAVPEPSSLILMCLGVAGIGWKRRKAST